MCGGKGEQGLGTNALSGDIWKSYHRGKILVWGSNSNSVRESLHQVQLNMSAAILISRYFPVLEEQSTNGRKSRWESVFEKAVVMFKQKEAETLNTAHQSIGDNKLYPFWEPTFTVKSRRSCCQWKLYGTGARFF
jgi:hypothetical protein